MSLLCSLPNELRHLFLTFIPDLPTLSSLLTAYPPLLPLFTHRRDLLAQILSNTTPRQLARLASAVLLLQHHHRSPGRWIPLPTWPDLEQDFLSLFEGDETYKCRIAEIANPLAALEDMVRLYKDIDAWTDAFVESRCRRPEIKNGNTSSSPNTAVAPAGIPERPPSPTELYRLRRALWRFWLLCALTRGHLWPTRQHFFGVFLGGLTSWELEELECVYFFLMDAYRASITNTADQIIGEKAEISMY
ncbi:MAG: hypothetical protein Q9226_008150, partial [Calogaya cf. arnoldii]